MSNIVDLEKNKFDSSNNVKIASQGDLSGLLLGVKYNDIQASYPSASTELYAYYLDSVLSASVLITYTDSTKSVLSRAQRV